MRHTEVTVPELGLIAGTRAALGAGIGLLLADRLGDRERKAVGWTLVIFGALTTIPLAIEVFGGRRLTGSGRRRLSDEQEHEHEVESDRIWSPAEL